MDSGSKLPCGDGANRISNQEHDEFLSIRCLGKSLLTFELKTDLAQVVLCVVIDYVIIPYIKACSQVDYMFQDVY